MKEFLPFWPQIVIIGTMIFSLIKTSILDGSVRKNTATPFQYWFLMGTYLFLLISGGFFNHWGGAQIIWTIFASMMFVLGIVFTFVYTKSKAETAMTTVKSSFVSTTLAFGLYYWGGFFDEFFRFLMK